MFNVYVLLRSLLRAWWSIKATKTLRYLYSASGCSRATYLFHISKYLSHLKPDFFEEGIPVDPERPFDHYSRLATYCHVCLSFQRGVKPFILDGYTYIYPLRIGLRTVSTSSCVKQLFTGQKMASLYIVGSFATSTAFAFSSHLLRHFCFLFKSCIRLFKGTKNSPAAVSYGVNKTQNE